MSEVTLEDLQCLTPTEVANALQVSESSLSRMRAYKNQNGPPWIKIGHLVRYRAADVLAWQQQVADNQPR